MDDYAMAAGRVEFVRDFGKVFFADLMQADGKTVHLRWHLYGRHSGPEGRPVSVGDTILVGGSPVEAFLDVQQFFPYDKNDPASVDGLHTKWAPPKDFRGTVQLP